MGWASRITAAVDPPGIPGMLQQAGVAGAGGAGFPSYVKWEDLDGVSWLLVNHQESEPNYYGDKWLVREYPEVLAGLIDRLVAAGVFDGTVVGTKDKYREEWLAGFEQAAGAAVVEPEELPVDPGSLEGVAVAYTPDVYTYSEENVLLLVTAGVQIGDDLPTEHGWIVHNTETLYNIAAAIGEGAPVTRKLVHVDGATPEHRCLDVPVGTLGSELLRAAGLEDGGLPRGCVMADGGPGWCYRIDAPPAEFGVRKRTNAVLVLDDDVVADHTQDNGRVDVLAEQAEMWDRAHETVPTRVAPEVVRIPLITNAAYEGFVHPSRPVVAVDDRVRVGEVVAEPAADGISNIQHASIPGTVTDVTYTHVTIHRDA